jgi:hypothetical protein
MMMPLAALACGLWIQTALRTFLWRGFSAFNANAGLGFFFGLTVSCQYMTNLILKNENLCEIYLFIN